MALRPAFNPVLALTQPLGYFFPVRFPLFLPSIAALALPLLASVPALAQGDDGPAAAQETRPALRAAALTSELQLDGRLVEAAWADADSIANLTEVEPEEGGTPAGRTTVRVLAAGDEIVIGVIAYDPDPAGIVSWSKQRDAQLGDEDHVRVVLDTYLDGRSGYVFAVNPGGARYDALVAERGEGENEDWDGAWQAATSRFAGGWSAEFRIPVRSLMFRAGLDTWGLNLERRIQRLQETSRWASPRRDLSVGQTSGAGLLTGLPRFQLGLGLSVRPSLTGGFEKTAASSPSRETGDASLDVTQRLSANVLASLSVNTDFAETEVDTRRTNVTRFPLFFPEKRTFFLEGSDVFDFGLGLGAGGPGRGPDLVPFFSRRIGLLEGQQVPVVAGGKVNGRIGRTSAGALAVRTDALAGLAPAATLGVARLRRDVWRESSAGVLATFGDPLGRASWMAGADFTFQTSRFRGDKNFLVGVWALALDREDLTGDRSAAGIKIDYPNDLWDVALTYRRIGESFDPSLGFVPRPGTHQVTFNASYQPRPRWAAVRQMFYESRNTLVTDLDGQWESYRVFSAPLNWQLESGDRIELNWIPQGERLAEPFEIADGVVISPGAHHFHRFRAEVELASKRRFSGQLTWWFGEFYEGHMNVFEVDVDWNPSPLLTISLDGERDLGHLPQGDFTLDLVGARVRLNFSPDLTLSSFVQYDDESATIGSNSRLRWTFHPLGELFLVHNYNLRDRSPVERWGFDSSQLLLKVQYAVRY